jgi:DNA anti-recombination protein RmuC
MPVTAKLSRRFYEQFGDEIANELVEWFNSVDATYRGDLRELNELNFARFDAKLEQRAAQLDAKLEQRTTQLEAKLELRAAQLEASVGRRFAQLEARIEASEAKVLERLEVRLGAAHRETLRWMLGSWSTVMLVLLGTLFAVLRTR